MAVWAAILAGGSGTRFWPLSTPQRPKQLLPLTGDRPLVAQAVTRLAGLVAADRIVLLTGAALADRLHEAAPEVPRDQVLIEPRPASTAPALAWAAHWMLARDADAQMLSLHADWAIGDDAAFRDAARRALDVARVHDVLATVGVRPTRDETGYGYVVPGARLGRARRVARFEEKPTRARAARLRRRGALWNTGLFAWDAARFLEEARRHARELRRGWPALAAGDTAGFFAAVTPAAVDVAVLERTERLAVVTGRFPWDDIGSWDALRRVRRPDANGNVVVGDVTVGPEVRDCVLWAEGEPMTVLGVRDVIVVRANGRILVTPPGRAEQLKRLVQGG
jgi:mannose-1-phosphate guanylyltransferase